MKAIDEYENRTSFKSKNKSGFAQIILFIAFLSMLSFASHGSESKPESSFSEMSLTEYPGWYWESQLQPTMSKSVEPDNLKMLAYGVVATLGAFQYDDKIYRVGQENEKDIMPSTTASAFSGIGAGFLGVGIAVTQLFLDNPNGLKHSRAIILTSASHVLLALATRRERPDGQQSLLPFHSSFPSGHAASAFATASSLGYAYGYKVGIPAIAVATAISAARVSEDTHWLSDVVAGAAIGLFWAKVSYSESKSENVLLYPVLLNDCRGLGIYADF